MSNDLHEGKNIRSDDIVWMWNGKVHREDGPAIQHESGYFAWYFEGKKHRLVGPAIIWHDGSMEWWINDVQLTDEEFNQWLEKRQLNEKLQSSLTEKPKDKRGKI